MTHFFAAHRLEREARLLRNVFGPEKQEPVEAGAKTENVDHDDSQLAKKENKEKEEKGKGQRELADAKQETPKERLEFVKNLRGEEIAALEKRGGASQHKLEVTQRESAKAIRDAQADRRKTPDDFLKVLAKNEANERQGAKQGSIT